MPSVVVCLEGMLYLDNVGIVTTEYSTNNQTIFSNGLPCKGNMGSCKDYMNGTSSNPTHFSCQ